MNRQARKDAEFLMEWLKAQPTNRYVEAITHMDLGAGFRLVVLSQLTAGGLTLPKLPDAA